MEREMHMITAVTLLVHAGGGTARWVPCSGSCRSVLASAGSRQLRPAMKSTRCTSLSQRRMGGCGGLAGDAAAVNLYHHDPERDQDLTGERGQNEPSLKRT